MSKKPSEYIYPFIKEQIKKKYNIDLVMLAGGVGFNAVYDINGDSKLDILFQGKLVSPFE